MKVAVFVEGTTELEFVWSLIRAICGQRGINFEVREQRHGRLVFLRLEEAAGASTYVLIVNCHSDGQVKTQIRDQYASVSRLHLHHWSSRCISAWSCRYTKAPSGDPNGSPHGRSDSGRDALGYS